MFTAVLYSKQFEQPLHLTARTDGAEVNCHSLQLPVKLRYCIPL